MTSLANEEPLYRLRHIYAGHETMRTPAMLALGLREVELPSMTSLASTQTFTPSSDSPHAWKRDPRPCLVTSHNLDKTGRYVYHICAMSTFGGEKLKADLAEIYQHFVIAVSPNQLDPDGPRIQTTPAWKAPGQWIMAYPYATKLLSDEWADPGTGVTGFHLSESMFDILEYEIGARYRELRKRMRNGGVRKHLQEDLKACHRSAVLDA
ncbi:hypothetical protein FA95DRAFT_443959 [Auriscalpium vulgare]|uniref:Uncharacterized protein n=1 Tax=Auriscalpium vulgare TaxID=40419 RepID=A0ACB8RG60_9AGAM|nr:hypothetical protein FA95DRAFT_443959 [Auriscalpium vulgare]